MDAEKSVVTIDRHEWTLKSPAHHTEVEKAVAVAVEERAHVAAHGTRTGDVHIHAADDEVIISFEAERPKVAKRGRGAADECAHTSWEENRFTLGDGTPVMSRKCADCKEQLPTILLEDRGADA